MPLEPRDERRDPTALPDDAADTSRACALLDAVLRRLPAELMRVFVLTTVEQLEASEIAVLEQIPMGTVASRLRRARRLVRRQLVALADRIPFGEMGP